MDARTGKVLWESNADTRLHPASLTKMLTLYIAFDAIRRGEISEDDMVTISANAARQPPSRLGLRAGQKIQLRYLIRAAAIKSANDAASAIGDHISGSERAFAQRMNRTAKALGMSRSSFRNAHGLTADGHLSTARDMTLLGRRLFYDFPQYYGIFSRKSDDAGIAQVNNTNRRFLDAYRGADGIKTGYTNAAGFNLTASAERGNKRLIATVFGGTSTAQRNKRISELLDHGFGNAPSSVRSVPPKPVALDEVASADTAPAGAVGKTLRIQTARATSPRPPARPAALSATAVAEVTSGVADVLASLAEQEAPPFEVVTDTRAAGEAVAEVAAAAHDDAAAELAASSAEDAVLSAPPRARPSLFASLATQSESSEEPEDEVAEGTAPETELAAAEQAQPETQQIAAAAVAPALPFQVVDATAPEAETELADASTEEELPSPVSDDGEELPSDVKLAGALVVPDTSGYADPSPRPRARPGDIVMTMASNDAAPTKVQRVSAAASTGEVVSRVSTSGGRQWAVTLGKFNARGTAERALLSTALAETRALDGALRKVTPRASGYEAIFAGLTQDQADLVCRRLQARAISCFTLGP